MDLSYANATAVTSPEPCMDHHAAVRRSTIPFAAPVVDYTVVKQEQYYANPKVGMSPKDDVANSAADEYSMPMDLTKKRDTKPPSTSRPPTRQPTPSTFVAADLQPPCQPQHTDILPMFHPGYPATSSTPTDSDNKLLQSYLTELALQDAKIKQSQIYRTQLPSTSYVTTMTSAKGATSSSAMSTAVSQSNGLLLAAMPSAISSYQPNFNSSPSKDIGAASKRLNNHMFRDPIRQTAVMSPISVAIEQQPTPLHPFDALKNSPNPSKVTYTKMPLNDGLTWSLKPIAEPPSRPEPTQTMIYNLSDESPNVTITVNETATKQHVSSEQSNIGMDTLAEIAASSVKLDTTIPLAPAPALSFGNPPPITSQPSALVVVGATVPPTAPGFKAKSVASEYLKRTSAEYMKAHFTKSDREDSDVESESDGEANAAAAAALTAAAADPTTTAVRTVVVGEDGFKSAPPTTTADVATVHRGFIQEDGRSACKICSKTFPKKHQMQLHMNIHYMERKHRCEPCGVGFRTHSTLQKHERGEAHKNKALMSSTFGVPTTTNPRPFECCDCNIAFRIHGHLAKHLRSKTHVQKLECLQKLPFGTYAEIERASVSLTEIDTTDCENSLASLRQLAQRLLEKDPSKLAAWQNGEKEVTTAPAGECSNSDDGGEPIGSADDDVEAEGGLGVERVVVEKRKSASGEDASDSKRRKLSGSET